MLLVRKLKMGGVRGGGVGGGIMLHLLLLFTKLTLEPWNKEGRAEDQQNKSVTLSIKMKILERILKRINQ
jgi:hypothetical protein